VARRRVFSVSGSSGTYVSTAVTRDLIFSVVSAKCDRIKQAQDSSIDQADGYDDHASTLANGKLSTQCRRGLLCYGNPTAHVLNPSGTNSSNSICPAARMSKSGTRSMTAWSFLSWPGASSVTPWADVEFRFYLLAVVGLLR
jgi:hypothetical protein